VTGLVREFLAAWERRDTRFILDHLSDDAVYHAMALPPIVGKTAVTEFTKRREASPPPRIEVHHQIAMANVVMNERTDHVVLNGRVVTIPICATFEVEDGRIKAWREYFDLGPARAAYDARHEAD
jgi:limonene-1,2-epoxide hydrolase